MSKSIMIVDDNDAIRRNLRTLFKTNGDWYVCAEAVNGLDALQKCREFHPDFVVLDFSMPIMDGIEAAPKLKEISPKSPIVMLTAFKDRALEEKAYRAGITWVLSKNENMRKIVDFARVLMRPDAPVLIPETGN